MNTPLKPVIVQPGAGQEHHAFGDTISVKLGTEQTGGALTILHDITPPGGGPPPHVHAREDEIFIVIEGRVNYLAEGRWTEVKPGGVVYLPKGSVHTFKNIGDTLSKQWVILTPSGFENFFARCAVEFAK